MDSKHELKKGKLLSEGKTKEVWELSDHPEEVLLVSKDRITAGDGAKAHDLEGKARVSTLTTTAIFQLLNSAGIKTHFIRQQCEKSFVAHKCHMIPIEWVSRRIATGSFLKRNEGVKEGYRFTPPKIETFFKDDANNDPQLSFEQCLAMGRKFGGVTIGKAELQAMKQTTQTVFEILEKAWASQDCSLIDMKVEYGVKGNTGEIVLADVIDSDSWRLWPSGDKRLMVDKQVYREMGNVTAEGLDLVKRNFEWVSQRVQRLLKCGRGRVVVFMGSASDSAHCEKIKKACSQLAVRCELRVSSAHKQTDQTMRILNEYEGDGVPTVIIAVAGRSNGLGPVLSGNTVFPVVNCPPVTADWAAQDVWSSLRLPSGLGCSTVLGPEAAALAAAQILALGDHVTWAALKGKQLNTWLDLLHADSKMRQMENGLTNGVSNGNH